MSLRKKLILLINSSMASLIWKPKRLRSIINRALCFAGLILAFKLALFLALPSRDQTICVNNHIFFNCLKSPSLHSHQNSAEYYSSVFQDLISQGFLSIHSKSLCVGTFPGDSVVTAMRDVGVRDAVGISTGRGDTHGQPFDSETFEFEFCQIDGEDRPAEIASEICRTLKPGGFFVVHTKSAQDSYSLNSLLELFSCCRLVSAGEIDGLDSPTVREIVMRKDKTLKSSKRCSSSGQRSEIALNAEALFEEEAMKKPRSATKSEENLRSVKYLTTMVDISFKRRYVYIDVGARSYDSSIGDWFVKQYPKQNKEFEIFALESDRSFRKDYVARKNVTLLPMAAWIRNETLFFEIARSQKKKKKKKKKRKTLIGRFQPVVPTASYVLESAEIRGFDFALWLENLVSRKDFVVVKMDARGAEFQLIPRMVETGAICLVDEIFLVCHFDRNKRRVRYRRSYGECLRLFRLIRDKGVLVHQWW